MRRRNLLILPALVLLAPAWSGGGVEVCAQETPTGTEALDRLLYPPELIMQHRRAIALDDEQRDVISGMIQELQGRVVGLQWELLDDVQLLTETLEAPRVDLDRAMDRLEGVLDTERRIKEAHLELLIRIKNVLRPEQQEALDRLRGTGAQGGSAESRRTAARHLGAAGGAPAHGHQVTPSPTRTEVASRSSPSTVTFPTSTSVNSPPVKRSPSSRAKVCRR